MRRQEGTRLAGADLLLAPACIDFGFLDGLRVACWTTPNHGAIFTPGLGGNKPFLGTVEMDNTPANTTRPDLRLAGNFFGTDPALVVEICHVLMDALPDFWHGRLRDVCSGLPLSPTWSWVRWRMSLG